MEDGAAAPAAATGSASEPAWVTARRRRLLAGLDLAHTRGIEIGALAMPLARRPEANVRYVDHTDQATLRAKYKDDPNVRVDHIVPVDAIWGERTLAECLGGENGFDYAIASHVIEHVPDLVGWLQEVAAVLAPGGRLYLAIPDRRYTFDFYRRTSSLAEVVGAHLTGSRRPSPMQVFDQGAYFAHLDAPRLWAAPPDAAAHLSLAKLRQALEVARVIATSSQYLDVHCWVFTPRSLLEILLALSELGLLPYRCRSFATTEPGENEVMVVLERIDAADAGARTEARDSLAAPLARLTAGGDDTAKATDEPALGLALARAEIVAAPGAVAATGPERLRWRSRVQPAAGGQGRLLGRLAGALARRMGGPRPAATGVLPPLRWTARPLPPRARMGREIPAYSPLYQRADGPIDADHGAIARLPTEGPLIAIDPPGFLRVADAEALYELAYYCTGDVVELVAGSALSTVFLCQAAANGRRGHAVVSVETQPAHADTAARVIRELGLSQCYRPLPGDALRMVERLIAQGSRAGLVFVDFAQSSEAVGAVALRLPELLAPGGLAVFHDLNDACNAGVPPVYGIHAAVARLLEHPSMEFLGLVGCCGVVRRRPD